MNENFSIIRKQRGRRGDKTALLDYQLAYLKGEIDPVFQGKFTIFAFYNLYDGKDAVSCIPNLPGANRHPRELWETYRSDFLPKFISEHPGTRPLPWWQWDCPDGWKPTMDDGEAYRALEQAKERAKWSATKQKKYLKANGLLQDEEN